MRLTPTRFALATATALGLVMTSPALAQQGLERGITLKNGAPMSFADLIDNVAPAVVSLNVESSVNVSSPFEEFGFQPEDLPPFLFGDRPRASSGSGFIVSADGFIVTNNHVVADSREITVNFHDGSSLKAEVIGTDPSSDLAVIKVNREEPFEYVSFAEDVDVRVGDWVVAIGNPFNLGVSASAGIVSATNRDVISRNGGRYTPFIQIDAPINPGNSGGPSFDLQGRVIGVNSQIISRSGGSNGVGFAISADAASSIVEALIEEGVVRRGWLGVLLQSVDEDFAAGLGLDEARGAIVQQVVEDSPAEDAGFSSGDIIIAIEGEDIEDSLQATRIVGNLKVDERAKFRIIRDGRERTLTVTIGEREDDGASERPARASDANRLAGLTGMSVRNATAEEIDRLGVDAEAPAVVVTRVYPGGPAEERGIGRGSVILEVNSDPVETVDDFESAINDVIDDGREVAILTVLDRAGRRFAPIRLNINEE